jgi:hypothetical protein
LPNGKYRYKLVGVSQEEHRLFEEKIAKLEADHKKNWAHGANVNAEARKRKRAAKP